MRVNHDYFIVAVGKHFHSDVTKSGIITINEAYTNIGDINSNAHRTTYGIVKAVPRDFTDEVIELVDEGLPNYNYFISGEHIEMKERLGYRQLPEYECSTFDKAPEITVADWAKRVSIEVGDKIYFDYLVLGEENFLGKHLGKMLYKVRVDQIYCAVRKIKDDVEWNSFTTKIFMQGGWVLADPDMETWEEITTKSGILMRPAPGAHALRAKMRHFQGNYSFGETVVYLPNSDAVIKIEGKEYLCFHDSWIIATIEDK